MCVDGRTGPGFTVHPQRIRVSITRQISGLFIVGDIEGEEGEGTTNPTFRDFLAYFQKNSRVALVKVTIRLSNRYYPME